MLHYSTVQHGLHLNLKLTQESWAIAKMSMWCALKILGVPDYAHGHFARNF